MAAVSNAFNLLHGSDGGGRGGASEESWSTAGKKKRKNKAKDNQRPVDAVSLSSSNSGLQAPPSLADSAASIAEHAEQQNGHIEDQSNDGFQAAGRKGGSRNSNRAGAAKPAAALISQADAAELLRCAAESVTGSDRLRLWQEWARQLADTKAGRGVSYAGSGGQPVSFEQVLRSSRAVQLSVQGCLAEAHSMAGSGDAAAAALRPLLAAFAAPTISAERANSAASAVAQWCGLLAAEAQPPPELLLAAQRAVSAVLSSLLSVPEAAGASPTAADLSAIQGQLAAAQAAADVAKVPKEAAAARRRLLQLTERQLAGGGGGEPSQADTAAAASVAALIAVAEQRLRASQLMTASTQSGGAQRAAAVDAFKAEDAALAAQAANLEARAATLQAQLNEVRRQQEALSTQRAGLRAQYASVLDQPTNGKTSGRVGGKAAGKPAPPDAALHERQLAAARDLAALLGGSGGATSAAAAPAGEDAEAAAAEYLAAVQASLQADVAYLNEIEERVRSATERLQRVRRQGQDLTRLGLTDKEAANQKLQATLQRTIKDAMAAGDEVAASAAAAAAGLPKHAAQLEVLPPAEASAAVDAVKQLAAAAVAAHQAVAAAAAGAKADAGSRKRTPEEVARLLREAAAEPQGAAVEQTACTAPAGNGEELSALSARLASMETGSSLPQRAPRAGRRERSAAPGGTPKLANGTAKPGSGTAGHRSSSSGSSEIQPAAPPAAATKALAQAPGKSVTEKGVTENGISPEDKVTAEPAKRAPSGSGGGSGSGGSSAVEAAAATARALSGLGAWGRPLGS